MDGNEDISFFQSHGQGGLFVVDIRHDLHLEVMVPRAERSHFTVLALLCRVRNMIRLCAVHPAVVLDINEIVVDPVSVLYSPLSAAHKHLVEP